MEDVQIPCAVLQRFILIDPQFISCFSDLKYFTVIFFVKQGSKFAVCIDCNGVKTVSQGYIPLLLLLWQTVFSQRIRLPGAVPDIPWTADFLRK